LNIVNALSSYELSEYQIEDALKFHEEEFQMVKDLLQKGYFKT